MKTLHLRSMPQVFRFERPLLNSVVLALLASSLPICWVAASDHGDMPTLGQLQRQDARITDLYAFREEDDLVLAMCLNPAVPPSVEEYVFSSDLTVSFHIDTKAEVDFGDPEANQLMGGTLVEPSKIKNRITIQVTFNSDNEPQLKASGLSTKALRGAQLFTGLRDDPFIRGPRIGRNVAAVVISLPLRDVLHRQSELLIWGTTEIPELRGMIADHAGRALRSMFPENDPMNGMDPCDHFLKLGQIPDVVIFDTDRPAAFPNGRTLTDDVVDLVGDGRILTNDDPFPGENDVPFMPDFPYLAPPHSGS